MTDGYSGPDKPVDQIAAELRQREVDGKVHVFALGMGTGFKKSELEKFTDRTMAITDWDFERFFGWLLRVLVNWFMGRSNIYDTMLDDEDMITMSEAFKNNE